MTMKSLFLSMSAIVLGLAITSVAQAGKPGSGSKSQGNHPSPSSQSYNNSSNKSYNNSSNKSFNKSFTKDNFHCTHYSWCSKFGCYCYWCPSSCCYYYWCAPRCCYLPVSYIETYPPQVVTTATVSQVVNVQNTGGSPGSVQSQGEPPPPPAGLGAGPVTAGTPSK
jgi:hypothetical protein